MLTFGSLFTGIGGIDLGLEKAGMTCQWQVENDPSCIMVLERHWPEVKRYGDITRIKTDDLERVDVIAGGFPCQDVSGDGRKSGIGGERSGLWKEYWRIIRDLRPRYVIVENVAGLLARGFGDVLADLSQIGYDAEWETIPASAFGAPHKRNRVFIVAYPAVIGLDTDEIFGRAAKNILQECQGEGQWLGKLAYGNSGEVFKIPDDSILSMVDGVSARLVRDPIRMLGNAVVPMVAEYVGRLVANAANVHTGG